jgi:hypothetical protein
MLKLAQKLWQRGLNLIPLAGFYFDRPLVLLQSDDWGRVGLRDQEGLEQLRSAGLTLGERPYDFYTLETADDLRALREMLMRHRDSVGRNPCVLMNFVSANLDFARMEAGGFEKIHVLPLADGLPRGWSRPGLLDAFHEGIAEGLFHPGLHGTTHFCRSAVGRSLTGDSARASLLRTLWRAGTPYIHWRMPWIGYEYWDPEQTEEKRFLPADSQRELIGQTMGEFTRLFSTLPQSAVAPGHRANRDTHRAWAQHGIRVAQNGSGALAPPHFDRHEMLNLSRTINFEIATDTSFSVEECLRRAEACFRRGTPAIVSVHSINFHSTVRDVRSRTVECLDQFFTALESKHADLLYLHDEDLLQSVTNGSYKTQNGTTKLKVTKKTFIKSVVARQWRA